jgi:ATP-dependent Clp protease ATP-binding subunit ClpA
MPNPAEAVAETAESEVKYWGGNGVGLLHLAVALSKRSPDTFKECFGEDGLDKVTDLLKARRYGSTDTEERNKVLAASEGSHGDDAYLAIAQALRSRLDWIFEEAQEPTTEMGATESVDALTESASEKVEGTSPPPVFVPVEGGEQPRTERSSQVDDLLVMLGRAQPLTPLLVGRAGSGRSTVLHELAGRLQHSPDGSLLAGYSVVVLDPSVHFANGAAFKLDTALSQIDGPTIVCIDDVEVLLEVSAFGLNRDVLKSLRRAIDDPNYRLVLAIDESMLGQLQSMNPEFTDSLVQLPVQLPVGDAVRAIVTQAADHLAEVHRVTIAPAVVDAAAALRSSTSGLSQPGLGISALDSACTRAVLRGSPTVDVPDLRGGDVAAVRIDFPGLCANLRDSVVGQDQVVERVAKRLALTKAGLDLRPERPDGVFLFVGPTGVGKTEMARAISREVFGHADRMIRLDMSEYVHDWAISRLIGPQPGYVGSTEPGSWLTTRVMAQPGTVVLLDEIEKAHPLVWNTFLQVFDAGRLTDSRGEVADFSHTVVIMTSNLGAEAYSKRNVGFGAQTSSVDEAEVSVMETIRRSLSPELINRLDDILMFRPLEMAHIRDIAQSMVEDQVQRVAGLGYQLDVGPAIIDHLTESGYDPAFGARHLQRNVDRQLLEPLAVAGGGSSFVAALVDGVVVWKPAG